jgi:septal ring factor EnvC (AmiA/AmiB activator)
VEERAALLEARERELVKRDAELNATEQMAATSQEHLEKRRGRIDKIESTVNARLHEIEERESAVTLREAQIEADVDILLDKLERKEAELADLEVRLERKERDLAVYVGNLQAQGRVLTPDDSDWWAKQLGKKESVA